MADTREDGWAAMSAAGVAARRQAPFDPRNYGVRNFTAVLEDAYLFDIAGVENGQSYVADRLNKKRISQPRRQDLATLAASIAEARTSKRLT